MGDNKRVLIVEDSAPVAEALAKIIGSFDGYEVCGKAHDGAEGLRLYLEQTPDVVCMDLIMPRMDGVEAVRSILNKDANAQILMISGAADAHSGGVDTKIHEAIKLGAKGAIAKPFRSSQVRDALAAV